jgi:hypothetical protein
VRDTQGVAQHGAKRCDAGATGDEQKAPFFDYVGKGEAADRSFDVDRQLWRQGKVRTGETVSIDADEELEAAVTLGNLRRIGDGVRTASIVSRGRHEDRLA